MPSQLSPDELERIRRIEVRAKTNSDDIAELRTRVGKIEDQKDDLMKAITRHVDDAVASSVRKGLEPIAALPLRVDSLERETAKQTPLILQTRDAVISYQAIERARAEHREIAGVDYDRKWNRWKIVGPIVIGILTVLAGLAGAAIGSQPHH